MLFLSMLMMAIALAAHFGASKPAAQRNRQANR
jgi:hypothetical protein